jgi:membrane protein implicated in regulation of membrane protease activity
VLAGLFLFRGPIGVDPVVLLPTAVVAGGGAVALGRVAWRSRRLAGSTGVEAIVGGRATVRSVEGDEALLVLQGSWWTARAVHGTLHPGQRVRVVEMDGLKLVVEPEPEPELESDPERHDGPEPRPQDDDATARRAERRKP